MANNNVHLSLFCKVQNLDTEGFQLAGSLLQHSDLMRDCDVGKAAFLFEYSEKTITFAALRRRCGMHQPSKKIIRE